MNKTKIKALFITFLFFGGLAYILFGKPSWEKITNLWNSPPKKHASAKSNKSSGTSKFKKGQVIDKYKGVDVYFNGSVTNVFGRNTTKDGYNLGLKYQCVEFSKRFYYQVYKHKMPDSYGHAKDFFDKNISNAEFNQGRGMYQFKNNNKYKPKADDLCVIGASPGNNFGHLFIITKVTDSSVEFIQQNPGHKNPSRGTYELVQSNGNWTIKTPGLLGWLRMP